MLISYANQFQADQDDSDLSLSHKDKSSVVEMSMSSTMNGTHLYDSLNKKPKSTQHCLRNSLYDRLSASPHKVAKSVQAKESAYFTLCPSYCEHSSDEQKIFEEFEGRRFHNLCHKDIV